MSLFWRFGFILAAGAFFPSPAAVGQPDPNDLAKVELLQNTLTAIAEEVSPSVVAIRAYRPLTPTAATRPNEETPDPAPGQLLPAEGSGVIISADGLVLTSEHVIHDASPNTIECKLSSGERYTVQGITSDPRSDLAVLRIDAKDLRPAKLGQPDTVKQGHFAIVMGNPFGSASNGHGKPAMAFGVISSLGRDLTRELAPDRYYGNLIQTDARINPGNSGGPLLNLKGEVIGINAAISSRSGGSEGVGYAIPIDERTREIIARLSRGEPIEYGYIGITLTDPPRNDHSDGTGSTPVGGAMVTGVNVNAPAYAAKVLAGDIVVGFDGQPVEDVDKLVRLVGAAEIGTPVNITVLRDGRLLRLHITPVRRENVPEGINMEPVFSWRGMKLTNPTPQVRGRFHLPDLVKGIVIIYVETGSKADKAGLKPGQIIQQINDECIQSVRRLRKIETELDTPVRLLIQDDPPRTVELQ